MSENPYEPPAEVDRPEEDIDPEIERLKTMLARPAMAILIMSISCSVMFAVEMIPMSFLTLKRQGPTPSNLLGLAIFSSLFVLQIVQSIGAAQMRHRKSYRWAVVSMSLAMVPIITPFFWLGIPFGIWGLILLRRPEYREQFASEGHATD